MPLSESRLQKMARLAIRTGLGLKHGQMLVIQSPIEPECVAFARQVAGEAYSAGAHDVVIQWGDERFSRIRYEMASDAVFSEFPEWRYHFFMDYALQGAAFLTISAQDPELFRGISPERITTSQRAAGAALLEYRQRLMKNQNTWCILSVPTASWACRVFPGITDDEAVERLWDAIFAAVRVTDEGDPALAWEEHLAFLARAADFMNTSRFRALRYQNGLGTDLTVELPEEHIWAGGAEYSEDGTIFVANLPTEEIYTAPRRDGTEGTVAATRPLVYQGNLIEGMRLTFSHGHVANCFAKRGREHLDALLATDDGASFLGEVALVPQDSPSSRSGILFYNTLFDENASCHFALGKAYPTCIRGGDSMESAVLAQHGINDSLIHEDFMIGSEDLSITGIRADGSEIPVFINGNFAPLK